MPAVADIAEIPLFNIAQWQLGERCDPVIALLAIDRHVLIAGCAEGFFRKICVRAFGFLQANHVRRGSSINCSTIGMRRRTELMFQVTSLSRFVMRALSDTEWRDLLLKCFWIWCNPKGEAGLFGDQCPISFAFRRAWAVSIGPISSNTMVEPMAIVRISKRRWGKASAATNAMPTAIPAWGRSARPNR
jgi:hypothetical protein